jgi:hypothetical protein
MNDTIEHGDFDPQVSEYQRKTPEQIKELAMQIYRNEVFTSWMIRKHDIGLLTSIFMPLVFIDELMRKGMIRDKVHHFFANMSEAGPMTINGYPVFFSMGMLDAHDGLLVDAKVKSIVAAIGDI